MGETVVVRPALSVTTTAASSSTTSGRRGGLALDPWLAWLVLPPAVRPSSWATSCKFHRPAESWRTISVGWWTSMASIVIDPPMAKTGSELCRTSNSWTLRNASDASGRASVTSWRVVCPNQPVEREPAVTRKPNSFSIRSMTMLRGKLVHRTACTLPTATIKRISNVNPTRRPHRRMKFTVRKGSQRHKVESARRPKTR